MNEQTTWSDLQSKVVNCVSKTEGLNGMTVNERLYASDLMEDFNKYKKTNKAYAEYILKALKVDTVSISKILNI